MKIFIYVIIYIVVGYLMTDDLFSQDRKKNYNSSDIDKSGEVIFAIIFFPIIMIRGLFNKKNRND